MAAEAMVAIVLAQAFQEKFGGVEPLIVVAEGKDRDAMKEPNMLRKMEAFQRTLERDPGVGYSFSLADIIRAEVRRANDGIDPATRFLAVAVNGAVVRRAEWVKRRTNRRSNV